MKVFISHTFFDEDLKLAQSLEQLLFKVGIEGYLAETRRTYDKLIRDKIILEIKNSDHMIAILTERSIPSTAFTELYDLYRDFAIMLDIIWSAICPLI